MAEKTETGALIEAVQGLKAFVEANQTIRNKTVNQVSRNSPWEKKGLKRSKLKAPAFYMNGARCNAHMLSNDEIDLINQLKPGRYNKRKWEVMRRKDRSLDLRYKNAKVEDRMELKGAAINLPNWLRMIVTEMEANERRKKAGDFSDDDE